MSWGEQNVVILYHINYAFYSHLTYIVLGGSWLQGKCAQGWQGRLEAAAAMLGWSGESAWAFCGSPTFFTDLLEARAAAPSCPTISRL